MDKEDSKVMVFLVCLIAGGMLIGYALKGEGCKEDKAGLATKLKAECAIKAAELAAVKSEEPERLALTKSANGDYAPLLSDAQGYVYAKCLTKAEVATAKKLSVDLFQCECKGK